MTENVQSSSNGSKVKATATPPVPTSSPVETSENSSRTSSPNQHAKRPATNEPLRTEAQKAQAVADLFAPPEKERPDSTQDSAPQTPDASQQPAPEAPEVSTPDVEDRATLAALAEALGVEAKDLYALEIPLGDGEAITLGKLKDAHKAAGHLEREYQTRRNDLDRRELSMVQEQHLMRNVLAALEPQITPQLARYIDDFDRRVDAEERMALGRLVPEIADRTSRAQFIDRAVDRFAEVTGRSKQEAAARLGMLRGRGSAMDIKFLHAAIEAFEELDRLKGFKRGAERQEPAKAKRPGGPKGQTDRLTAARKLAAGGTDADKAAAITALLRG